MVPILQMDKLRQRGSMTCPRSPQWEVPELQKTKILQPQSPLLAP